MNFNLDKLEKVIAGTPLGTAFKAFIAIVVAASVADFVGAGDISLSNWQTWVISGLASTTPIIVNWLNPEDSRYGKNSAK